MATCNAHVAPYNPSEYVTTAGSQNKVSRKATILGSSNIVLGGKCIIQHGVIIRGDLKRPVPPPPPAEQAKMSAAQLAQHQKGGVVISAGRYCIFGEGCVIRPPYRTLKGVFSYYTLKLGDHVRIGPGSVVQAGVIGSNVDIGKDCIIGRMSMIRDCVQILDGTVLAPGTVVPPLTIWGGSPGQQVGELPETYPETSTNRAKEYYNKFKPAS
ncbi:dynactin, subunit p25 [Tilletiaria anomala UBC 951]|uniref:Dynactin subunit 5 n=1 Tax=Tilletiaria anomala (strain ATCC 24038 / CBS 436.72 / UBC 951) TaxID=1037660 RepID=A0A066VJZ2_TILAU|nr:dynactin, subunit p25 [Tilletiaria anomala UBC 951]KDN41781.1 dynactin, subunit p25 [Tilletiaria anomala UBC 951]